MFSSVEISNHYAQVASGFDIETSSFKEENYEYDYHDDELYSFVNFSSKITVHQKCV